MEARDPSAWVAQPLRQAIDGVLYRWLALFCAPVAMAAVHKLAASDHALVDDVVHLGLPASLAAYVAVHLIGRLWRRRGAPDGWTSALQADHGTVIVARWVGWVAVIGSGLAVIAPLGTLHDPRQFVMEVLLWFPLLFPLYCLAVWVTLDCARHRPGRAVEDSRRRVSEYWRGVAREGRGGSV